MEGSLRFLAFLKDANAPLKLKVPNSIIVGLGFSNIWYYSRSSWVAISQRDISYIMRTWETNRFVVKSSGSTIIIGASDIPNCPFNDCIIQEYVNSSSLVVYKWNRLTGLRTKNQGIVPLSVHNNINWVIDQFSSNLKNSGSSLQELELVGLQRKSHVYFIEIRKVKLSGGLKPKSHKPERQKTLSTRYTSARSKAHQNQKSKRKSRGFLDNEIKAIIKSTRSTGKIRYSGYLNSIQSGFKKLSNEKLYEKQIAAQSVDVYKRTLDSLKETIKLKRELEKYHSIIPIFEPANQFLCEIYRSNFPSFTKKRASLSALAEEKAREHLSSISMAFNKRSMSTSKKEHPLVF